MADGVKIRIDGDDSGFRKTLSGIADVTKKTVKGISTAIKGISVAVGAISTAVSAAGVASVKYNASVEQLQTSFEVMTGSASRAVEITRELRDLGARTPYEFTGLAQTVQTLMQYNIESADAIKTTEMIGDIAQGSADKMSSIATAYGQMSSAGKVQLEDVKQMIEAGFNPLLTISNKTGESMASLYDRISDGTLAVSEITDAMITATSEGGQFFQSMQKQSQTLSGQLSTLQDNVQSFGGSLFSGVSTALQSNVLPQANAMIEELQRAFELGGTDGLVDALSKQIPRLTTAGVDAVSKMFAGISKKLPGLMKNLFSALPAVLESAVGLVPQMTDALFGMASEAIEQLTTRIPEWAPILLKGFGGLSKSLILGVSDLLKGVFIGAEKALKGAGILRKSVSDVFQDAIDNADTEHLDATVAEINANIKVNTTTPEDVILQIETEIKNIKDVLLTIEGLSESEVTAIQAAILTGSGVTLLEETLESINISDSKAKEIAGAIDAAMKVISDSVEALGLSDEAKAHIAGLIEDNASRREIQSALEGFGIDSETAKATAKTISGAMGEINDAAKRLKLSDEAKKSLRAAAFDNRRMIVAAMQILKVDDSQIQGVLESYDGVAGSLVAGAKGIYTYISNMFTDGVPETDSDVLAAKTAVESYFDEVYARIEKYRSDKIAALEASGLTGEALTSAVAQIDAECRGVITEMNTLEQEFMRWTEENAQQSTAFVEGNLGQLEAIAKRAQEVAAKIDVLTNEQFNVYRNKRSLVQAGAAQSEKAQLEAFAITAAELEERLDEAESKAGAALDEAAEKFQGNAEAYSAREKEILKELAQEKQAAYDIYNEETEKTIEGIIKSDSGLFEEFSAVKAAQETVNQMQQLGTELRGAVIRFMETGEPIDTNQFFRNLEFTGVDLETLAEKLGITKESLNAQIVAMLSGGTTDTELYKAIETYVADKREAVNAAMEKMMAESGPLMQNLSPVLSKAIEEKYLTDGITGIDWTSAEALLKTMLSSVTSDAASDAASALTEYDFTPEVETMGENVKKAAKPIMRRDGIDIGKSLISGMESGIRSRQTIVKSAAKSICTSIITTIRNTLGIHSPSTVAKELGGYFGDGFKIGMMDSMSDAIRSIDGIAGTLNLTPKLSAPDLTGAFAGMLSNMTLNTEGNQRLALYVNGRQLGTVMAEDNRYAQNAYNHSIGMGYGK